MDDKIEYKNELDEIVNELNIFSVKYLGKETASIIDFLIFMWNVLKNIGKNINIKLKENKTITIEETIKDEETDFVGEFKNLICILEKNRDNTVRKYKGTSIDRLVSSYQTKGKINYYNGSYAQIIDESDKFIHYDNEINNNTNSLTILKDSYVPYNDYNNIDFHTLENGDDENNYFYYTVANEEVNSMYELEKESDKFIWLLHKIYLTINEYKTNSESYHNYFDEEIKKYFYKRALEKYRTVDIEEKTRINITYKTNGIANFDSLIPSLYNKLDGRAGTIGFPRVMECARGLCDYYEEPPSVFFFSKINNNKVEISINLSDIKSDILRYTAENFFDQLFKFCKFRWMENDCMFLNNVFKEQTSVLNIKKVDDTIALELESNELGNKANNLEGRGVVLFDFLQHKLSDNLVSSPVSSNLVERDVFYNSKQFNSALDDRSFTLFSNSKIKEKKLRIFKKSISNEYRVVIDVSDFDFDNCVETIKFIKIKEDDKNRIVPIDYVYKDVKETNYINLVNINNSSSNEQYISGSVLYSNSNSTITSNKFNNSGIVFVEGNVLNDNNTDTITVNEQTMNIENSVKKEIVEQKIITKLLVIKRGFYKDDGIPNEDDDNISFISLIGFCQSQNDNVIAYKDKDGINVLDF